MPVRNPPLILLPTGTNPSAAAVGAAVLDTTNNQGVVNDGGIYVAWMKNKWVYMPLMLPVVTDNIAMFKFPVAVTIVEVAAGIMGSTNVIFNIEERADGALNTPGTDVMTSDLTATASEVVSTTFSNPGIAAGASIVFVPTSISGTPDLVYARVTFTIDRT